MLWEESEGRAAAGAGGGVLYASVAGLECPWWGMVPAVCPTLAPGPAVHPPPAPGHRTPQFPSVATQVSTREHAHGNTQHNTRQKIFLVSQKNI